MAAPIYKGNKANVIGHVFRHLVYGMASVERYVGQSTILFIRDVARRHVNEYHSSMYEPRRSKIGSSKEIVDERKYTPMNDTRSRDVTRKRRPR